MKNHIFTAICLAALPFASRAQPAMPFNASASIDIGTIRAPHYVVGDNWWDLTPSSLTGIEFPAGKGANLNGYMSPMLYGIAGGQMRYSGNLFRVPGSDFRPGPVGAGDSTARAGLATAWNRIWKINRTTLDSFLARRGSGGLPNVPKDILEWPAKGNRYARGANSTVLTIDHEMAPFVDVNHDGIYSALDGDFPWIKGDQMLWWVFNDAGARSCSSMPGLNAEISVSAYSYASGHAMAGAIVYDYEVLNKGAALTDFHFGAMAEIDIQDPFDDSWGYDSATRLGVVYNAFPVDRVTGNRVRTGAGIVFLEQPGDTLGRTTQLHNYNGIDPIPTPFPCANIPNQLTRSSWRQTIDKDTIDAECTNASSRPGDRALTFSTRAMSLPANGSAHVAFALLAHDSAGSCGELRLDRLQALASTAIRTHWANKARPQSPVSVSQVAGPQSSIYPNPVDRSLNVRAARPILDLHVSNALGAAIAVPATATAGGMELNTSALVPGIYYLRISTASGVETRPFIRK